MANKHAKFKLNPPADYVYGTDGSGKRDWKPDAAVGGGSVTSAELSAVSANAASANAAETSNRISADNALSVAINVVSNAVSNETSNRISADNALSARVDTVSNNVSAVSNALSNEISNRISADNALSIAINTVSNAVSDETSNRISADNALSQQISVLSQSTSVAQAALSVRIDTVSNNASAISNALSNEISNRVSADNALSVRIDTVSNGVSTVSNALSNEISNRISADNALSAAINTVSNAASAADLHASTASAAATSVDARVNCDVIAQADILELFALADPKYAVQVVKHEQTSGADTKMDGQVQTYYARKNWSSVVLWNLEHPAHKKLTLDNLNQWPGRDLHAFKWLADDEIGALPAAWNFLVGITESFQPKLLHYTLGGPWFDSWKGGPFDDLWLAERKSLHG